MAVGSRSSPVSISQRTESLGEHEIYLVELHSSVYPHHGPVSSRTTKRLNRASPGAKRWPASVFFEVDQGAAEGKYHDYQRRLYWIDAGHRRTTALGGRLWRSSSSASGRPPMAARAGLPLVSAPKCRCTCQESPQVCPSAKQVGWPGDL